MKHSGKKDKAEADAAAAAAARATASATVTTATVTGRGHGKKGPQDPHTHDLRSGSGGRGVSPHHHQGRGTSPAHPPPNVPVAGPSGTPAAGGSGDQTPGNKNPPPFPLLSDDSSSSASDHGDGDAAIHAAIEAAEAERLKKLQPIVVKIKAARASMRRRIDDIDDSMRLFNTVNASKAILADFKIHKTALLQTMKKIQTLFEDIMLLDVPENYEEYAKRLDATLDEGRQPLADLSETICRLETVLDDMEEKRHRKRVADDAAATSAAAASATDKDKKLRDDLLASVGAPLPRVHKPNESLRPDRLKRDNTPVEFTVWCNQFLAYFSSSKMDQCTILEQQAYFKACLDSQLAATISATLTEKTPVITEWVPDSADPSKVVAKEKSAMLMLNEIFVYTYPFYNRRFDYYCAKQPQGLTASEWVRKLQRMRDECALSLLTEDEKFVHRILTSITDKDLVKELLKLNDPTLGELLKEIGRYEINKKRLKVTNKTSANVVQSKTNNPSASKTKQPQKSGATSGAKSQQKQSQTAKPKSGPPNIPFQCYRCGERDKAHTCKAREHVCKNCNKKGHYAGMCLSKARARAILASLDEAPTSNAATTATTN